MNHCNAVNSVAKKRKERVERPKQSNPYSAILFSTHTREGKKRQMIWLTSILPKRKMFFFVTDLIYIQEQN